MTVRVWDAATGQQLTQLDGHTRAVAGCAFSPDGNRIASASYDMTVRVWDAATGGLVGGLNVGAHCLPVAWAGGRIAAGAGNRMLIFDVLDGSQR